MFEERKGKVKESKEKAKYTCILESDTLTKTKARFVLSTLIRWIVIYPADSIIHLSNNRGLNVITATILTETTQSVTFVANSLSEMIFSFVSSIAIICSGEKTSSFPK